MGSRAVIAEFPSAHIPFPSPVPPCYHMSGRSLHLTLEAAQDSGDKDILPLPMASVPEPPVLLPLGLARCYVTSETCD